MRIHLQVADYEDIEALEHSHPTKTYRLRVQLRVRLQTGWSAPLQAIVDTGAPYSIIPYPLSTFVWHKPLYRTRVGGLVPNQFMNGSMAEIECMATDGEATSDEFRLRAILADQGGIPFILGLQGFLEQHELVSRISSREAWIQLH